MKEDTASSNVAGNASQSQTGSGDGFAPPAPAWIIRTAGQPEVWAGAIERMRRSGSRKEFTVENVPFPGTGFPAEGAPLLIAQPVSIAPANKAAQASEPSSPEEIELVGYAKLVAYPVFPSSSDAFTNKEDTGYTLNLRMDRLFRQPVSQADLEAAVPELLGAVVWGDATPVDAETWVTLREVILARDPEIQSFLPPGVHDPVVSIELLDVELPGPWEVSQSRQPKLLLRNNGTAHLPASFSMQLQSAWRGLLYTDLTHTTNQTVYLDQHIPPGAAFELTADAINLPSNPARYDVTYTLTSLTFQSGPTKFDTTYDVVAAGVTFGGVSPGDTPSGYSTSPGDSDLVESYPAWMVVASPSDANWDKARKDLSEKGIRRPVAISLVGDEMFSLRQDDLLILIDTYQSITGFARVEGLRVTSSKEGAPVPTIRMINLLDPPMERTEVELALPDLGRDFKWNQIIPVQPAEWTPLRELLLWRDPDLEDILPESTLPPEYGLDIQELLLDRPWEAGVSRSVRVFLRSTSTGRLFLNSAIVVESSWRTKKGPPAPLTLSYGLADPDWNQIIPPGGSFSIETTTQPLPNTPATYNVEWVVRAAAAPSVSTQPFATIYKVVAPKASPEDSPEEQSLRRMAQILEMRKLQEGLPPKTNFALTFGQEIDRLADFVTNDAGGDQVITLGAELASITLGKWNAAQQALAELETAVNTAPPGIVGPEPNVFRQRLERVEYNHPEDLDTIQAEILATQQTLEAAIAERQNRQTAQPTSQAAEEITIVGPLIDSGENLAAQNQVGTPDQQVITKKVVTQAPIEPPPPKTNPPRPTERQRELARLQEAVGRLHQGFLYVDFMSLELTELAKLVDDPQSAAEFEARAQHVSQAISRYNLISKKIDDFAYQARDLPAELREPFLDSLSSRLNGYRPDQVYEVEAFLKNFDSEVEDFFNRVAPQFWQATIKRVEVGQPYTAGAERPLQVDIRTTSRRGLPADSPLQVQLDWQLKDAPDPAGMGTRLDISLSEDLQPGVTQRVACPPVRLPQQPGAYRLRLALLLEDRLVTETNRSITVGRPRPDPQATRVEPTTDRPVDGQSTRGRRPTSNDIPTEPSEITVAGGQIIVLPPSDRSAAYTPPKDRLVIEIGKKEVRLYDGENPTCISENRLDKEKLENPERLSPAEYGRLLFKGLVNDHPLHGAESTEAGYRRATDGGAKNLPIELWPREDAPAYKWEYLVEPKAADSGRLPRALLDDAPLIRRHTGVKKEPVQVNPLRILVALCSPTNLGKETLPDGSPVNDKIYRLDPLDLPAEQRVFEKALSLLQEAGKTPLAEARILQRNGRYVTLQALADEIQRFQPHVLHLLAHGVFQEIRQQACLVMEDDRGLHSFVYAEDFDQAILGGDLRLVVLAACQIGNLARAEWQTAFAPRLLQKVPAVIAMQDDMPVDANQAFTQSFYGSLGRSGSISQAMAAARHTLYRRDIPGWSWGIPVLMLTTPDGQLFTPDPAQVSQYPEMDDKRLDVRSLEELGGQGDPSAGLAANDIQRALRRHGFGTDSSLATAIRAVAVPALASRPPEAALKVERQNRPALDTLNPLFSLDARRLQDYVEHNAGLTLNKSVYDQLTAALNAGKHIILIGPHGTGKTTLCKALCEFAASPAYRLSQGYLLTTATADWTTFDTVGGYMPAPSGALGFQPGIFTKAISEGKWLVIDEINRADIDKAFGELFTVLSGQAVDLPYRVQDQPVTILNAKKVSAAAQRKPLDWVPDGAGDYAYVVHPNWRIIGTMNVYDKSSLFQMSFAFMRRFAFIDFDLPEETFYLNLVYQWMEKNGLEAELLRDGNNEIIRDVAVPWDSLKPMQRVLRRCLSEKAISDNVGNIIQPDNPLMEQRELGPAILKDFVEYLGERYKQEIKATPSPDEADLLIGAFLLYVVPQLDSLDYDGIRLIYQFLKKIFVDELKQEPTEVLRRIRQLYPHIKKDDWEKTDEDEQSKKT